MMHWRPTIWFERPTEPADQRGPLPPDLVTGPGGSVWPDDYIDWALQSRPPVLGVVAHTLDTLLRGAAQRLRRDIGRLAERSVTAAFRRAHRRQQYPRYFRDQAGFQRWLGMVAVRQALRLLLRHRFVRRPLNLLPDDQRQVLGMLYLDQLTYGDLASILQVSQEQVRLREREALDALRQLL
jgi:hypothetical protein